MSTRVKIITGDIGPSVLPKHWNYRPFERREYSDGLVMHLESSPERVEDPKIIGTVWIAADGTSGGWHRRTISSPADIGALYAVFRRGLTAIGLYPLWTEDGQRRRLGDVTVSESITQGLNRHRSGVDHPQVNVPRRS